MPFNTGRYIHHNMIHYLKKIHPIVFLLIIISSASMITVTLSEEEKEKKTQASVQESTKEVQGDSEAPEGKKKEESEPNPATEAMQFLLNRKFAPPLSLFESIRLTENVTALIDRSIKKFKEPRREKALHLLTMIQDYVKLVDDRASSLLFYRWYYIERHRVTGDALEEQIFNPRPLIKNVSAISFEANRADVFIHYMKVIDIHNNATNFKINKWIINGLPRKEVCFLYFPTTIKRIILDYSTKPDAKASLSVYAGVTDRPEHGKAALYYLSSAKKEIEADLFGKAKTNLDKAKEYLIKFNRQQRL